jgi:hypothetical protein
MGAMTSTPVMTPIAPMGQLAPPPPPPQPGAVVQIPTSGGLPPGGLVTIESGGGVARCTLPCSLAVAPGTASVSLALMNRMLVRQVTIPNGPSTVHITTDNSSEVGTTVALGMGIGGAFIGLGTWVLVDLPFGTRSDRSLDYILGGVGLVGGIVLFVIGFISIFDAHGDAITVEPGYGGSGAPGWTGRRVVRRRTPPAFSFSADVPIGGGAVLGGTLRF